MSTPNAPAVPPRVILIHGAWAGAWIWDLLIAALKGSGLRLEALALAGSEGNPGGDIITWEMHLDQILASIDASDGSDGSDQGVVLVGHSGGATLAMLGAEARPERVRGVVYLAGIVLPSGASVVQMRDAIREGAGGTPDNDGVDGVAGWWEVTADGSAAVVPPEVAIALFLAETPPAVAIPASRRLVPQTFTSLDITPTWTAERAGSVPALYIEALRDRSLPIALQRYMCEQVGITQIATVDTDHAPQVSAVEPTARIIEGFVRALYD